MLGLVTVCPGGCYMTGLKCTTKRTERERNLDNMTSVFLREITKLDSFVMKVFLTTYFLIQFYY